MTNTTSAWRLVAEREVSTRVREKAFVIGVAITVVLVAGAVIVASLLSGRSSSDDIAVVGADAAAVVQAADASPLAESDNLTLTADDYASAEEAKQAVRDEVVDAALVPTDDGYELIALTSVGDTTERAITAAVSQLGIEANAAAQGVDLTDLGAGTTTRVELLDAGPDNAGARSAVAAIMVILFLLSAMIFGLAIAQSVTQEKESRVVEILAAAVPIRSLLWGKIAGNTVLALGQLVLIAAVGLGAAWAVGQTEVIGDVGPAVGWFLLLFLLGFVAMATLWAVGGALAARVQDINSTTMPVQTILFVPYMASLLGNDQTREILSMVPIAATMVMPGRLATGDVPMWQLGVAIAGTVLAAILLVQLGVKIYERSLLRTGNKLGYREALRLSSS